MARILTECPETGETVFTCRRMKADEFEDMSIELGFRCPSCDQIHKWRKENAWLEAPLTPTA